MKALGIINKFGKAKPKFCLSSHYNDADSYLYVNKTNVGMSFV